MLRLAHTDVTATVLLPPRSKAINCCQEVRLILGCSTVTTEECLGYTGACLTGGKLRRRHPLTLELQHTS